MEIGNNTEPKLEYIVRTNTVAYYYDGVGDDYNSESVNRSTEEEFIVSEDDLLLARRKAFDKAKSIISLFEEQPHKKIISRKFGEGIEGEPGFWQWYNITIRLTNHNDINLCVFDDGYFSEPPIPEWTNEEILYALIEEYSIFKKLKINVKDDEEIISVYDRKTKKKSKEKILSNEMDWIEVEINQTEDADFWKSAFEMDWNEPLKETIKSKASPKKKLTIISKSKQQLNINKDTLNVIIETTGNIIPIEFQKEINAVIEKWHKSV
ncbi:MAG: hypothetical protein WCL51_15265 [Bacteroidota bacterium]